MNFNPEYFEARKEKAKQIFEKQKSVFNPYFKVGIVLNSDGFHHLQFSDRRERNKSEQLLKFSLLPLALEVIKVSGTIQEYRIMLTPFGKVARDGFTKMVNNEYWGLVAIVGENKIKIKVVLRRVGTGPIAFWSVMPFSGLKNQKLSDPEIDNQ